MSDKYSDTEEIRAESVKKFAHFLIDASSGGEIHVSDLPDLVIEFLEADKGGTK